MICYIGVVDISKLHTAAWNNDLWARSWRCCQAMPWRKPFLFFSTHGEKHVYEADIVSASINIPTETRFLGVRKAADLTYWECRIKDRCIFNSFNSLTQILELPNPHITYTIYLSCVHLHFDRFDTTNKVFVDRFDSDLCKCL